ncbi:MAG: hydroxylamine oxidase [Candidatus Eisenbacteria bacterium]|uniref:Hydroxylamine oxidase n=1 Tax=Eiseniibacteriota bacterium TaxID=2212470 RepID=A0A948W8F9_UNCEI|nr:hydroxylamine oxidase [Candidatus Eisenbacteria bacterium]MBU1948593.1 hydroxylamine oxidase [Candidatus Eisenbacteria bacterium]MBU2693280.1 hydroxylamine oxidase [Candidatus Eisenbacteria bacterium]
MAALLVLGVPLLILLAALAPATVIAGAQPVISDDTEACLDCHSMTTSGIYWDWKHSRHAQSSLSAALTYPELSRRVSIKAAPAGMDSIAIGCAECHTLNANEHGDTFEHNGYNIHVVVTPRDCSTCHPEEVVQYAGNIMSNAHSNLVDNSLYQMLQSSINGVQHFIGDTITTDPQDELTDAESCLYCHGTVVSAVEMEERDTAFGEMSFPVLQGWPNQGVGRVNPDGSLGACTACHTRHQFSIEMARKPATCAECHKGPDVPASKVYEVSKHGNLYYSMQDKWSFDSVPWIPGRDFIAPTCATCHVSLLATEDGDVVAERTHRMNDRLAWRLLGVPYAHPHPISANTSIIQNKAGLPLPTELTGEPVDAFLIRAEDMRERAARMKGICAPCHAAGWTDSHFARLDKAIETTNAMTLSATEILLAAWSGGYAKGPAQSGNPFDEAIEKMWTEQWLFYANSIRFASAMGGADYGTFANGRWALSKNLREMHDWLMLRSGE